MPVDNWLDVLPPDVLLLVVALSEWLTTAATATAPPTPTNASAAVITAALRIPCSRAFMASTVRRRPVCQLSPACAVPLRYGRADRAYPAPPLPLPVPFPASSLPSLTVTRPAPRVTNS
ncbi:hypothetical protein JJ691_55660 [Kutzneria sp. CA-103260]|nr:hypothetical protein JJ691_55660 [Kutzneria sp. CA-103260]